MRASEVQLATLVTYEDHDDAINAIEKSPHNSTGDWHGCGATYLKKGAVKKIAAINRQIERKWPDTDEDGGC